MSHSNDDEVAIDAAAASMTDDSTPFLSIPRRTPSTQSHHPSSNDQMESGMHTPPLVRPAGMTLSHQSLLSSSIPPVMTVAQTPISHSQPSLSLLHTVGEGVTDFSRLPKPQPRRPRAHSGTALSDIASVQTSPGHPSHFEPRDSLALKSLHDTLRNANARGGGRIDYTLADYQLRAKAPNLNPTTSPSYHRSTTGPRSSILSHKLILPSLSTQIQFKRNLKRFIWGLTILFFLCPLIGFFYIHFSSSTGSNIPPSTSHHKSVDGPFYSNTVRICIAFYGAVWFVYSTVITLWSLKRSSFFPFKVRPLFIIYISNIWGSLILLWVWMRYTLSDFDISFDGGDGLFPACWFSQVIVGIAQFGLIAPYILRAWQLAMIFSTDTYTKDSKPSTKQQHQLNGSGELIRSSGYMMNGIFVPPSPSLNSMMSEDPFALSSVQHTPQLNPQQSPPFHLQAAPAVPPANQTRSHLIPSNSFTSQLGSGAGYPSTPPRRNTMKSAASAILVGPSNSRHSQIWATPRRQSTIGAYAHVIQPTTPSSYLGSFHQQHGHPHAQLYPQGSPSRTMSANVANYGWHAGDISSHVSSAQQSPMITPMLGPAIDGIDPTPLLSSAPIVPTTAASRSSSRKRTLFRCLDNLNDHKLSWIYFLLLCPYISLTILTHFIPDLRPLTNYYCTDCGPPTFSTRILWSTFGLIEVLAFSFGLYATRNVWDGFDIRRELMWAMGGQMGIILCFIASIPTGLYLNNNDDDQHEQEGQESWTTLEQFDEYLTIQRELFIIWRSILLFTVSIALPLVESYDLNALPVNKARVKLQGGAAPRPEIIADYSGEMRDRSASVSQQLRLGTPMRHDERNRAESDASGYASNTSSNQASKRGSRIAGVGDVDDPSPRGSFIRGQGTGIHPGLYAEHGMSGPLHPFPTSPSDVGSIMSFASFSHQRGSVYGGGGAGGSIPLTLTYIISHPDYFQYFVDYVSRDSQMELLWNFYISIVLYQDLDGSSGGGGGAGVGGGNGSGGSDGMLSGFERREMAQKIFQQYFNEETLRGNSMFSQWILCMANILQQEYSKNSSSSTAQVGNIHSLRRQQRGRNQNNNNAAEHSFVLNEREQLQALERVDEEIQHIASIIFNESYDLEHDSDLPRSLFDAFQNACLEIMEVWFYPKFMRSRHYKLLLREIQKSSIIQARIERAHFL